MVGFFYSGKNSIRIFAGHHNAECLTQEKLGLLLRLLGLSAKPPETFRNDFAICAGDVSHA
jgi:hypothetical protein